MSEAIDKDAMRRAIGVIAEQHLQKRLDHAEIITATVNSVDEDSRTCSVTTINGRETVDLDNVELMAEVADGILLIPSVDSTVKIAITKGLNPFVLQYSDIDKIVNTTGKTVFIQSDTFSLKTQNESAAKLLTDLVNAILQLMTTSPGGDGFLSPNSAQTFQAILKRIPNLFT